MSLLAFLTLSNAAHAWSHTQNVWPRSSLPLTWYLSSATVDDTIEMDVAAVDIQSSFDNWTIQAPCAEVSATKAEQDANITASFKKDNRSAMTFEDPSDELDSGVLAATLCQPTADSAFSFQGKNYFYTYECDIAYNETTPWISTDRFEAGMCGGEYLLEAVSTHEIGHLWGLGHSCNDPNDDGTKGDVPCDNPEVQNASMFWTANPCDAHQMELTSDDVEGLYALYGPYCSFEATASSERSGGAPLEVCFSSDCSESPGSVEWNFGDGNTSAEASPCHTYEEKGQYSVVLTSNGDGEGECGAWQDVQRARSYVVVCGLPEPAEGFEGLFSYAHDEEFVYQLINQVDTSVYGCIESIQWDVYEGDNVDEPTQTLAAWSPKVDLGGEGKYRVVLTVEGPGGQYAEEIFIDTGEVKGGSCSTTSQGASFAGLMVGAAALFLRRRRA
jgi:MYXO-CTERM domain-containing protein